MPDSFLALPVERPMSSLVDAAVVSTIMAASDVAETLADTRGAMLAAALPMLYEAAVVERDHGKSYSPASEAVTH